jgi:hypothetical protein
VLDVCFVLDATVSMERHIASMKSNIIGVIDAMLQRGVALRMACVAYRDWAPDGSEPTAEPRLQVQPFTTDAAAFRRYLDGIHAVGGWDEPEDVAGALQAAVDCTAVGPWTSASCALIHMADAPGHGLAPDGMPDNHPRNCPPGLQYKGLIRALAALRVAYFFFEIKPQYTRRMVAEFSSYYPKYRIEVADFRKPERFLEATVATLTETASRTLGR